MHASCASAASPAPCLAGYSRARTPAFGGEASESFAACGPGEGPLLSGGSLTEELEVVVV